MAAEVLDESTVGGRELLVRTLCRASAAMATSVKRAAGDAIANVIPTVADAVALFDPEPDKPDARGSVLALHRLLLPITDFGARYHVARYHVKDS